ncbi:uncharacterized protein ACNLHF_007193 isoform 1-T3 [Anomaloglossus baeobatrachus]
MGSNVAPAYANLFMDYFEGRFVYSYPAFDELAFLWARYIDDIFCIWQGDLESLLLFDDHINKVWPELKFTLNHHQEEISFLDTYIKKDTMGNLSSDLFRKPTDRNCMLLYSSCHPKSTKNSLPRSQFARVTRIVSDENTREQRLEEMSNRFIERNYPITLLKTERERLSFTTPSGIDTATVERIPFVHTYHPSMPKIYNIINRHWPLLKKAYPEIGPFILPPIMCKKRPQNIKDSLVKADIGSDKKNVQTLLAPKRTGTFPCLNCPSCSNVIKGDHFTHPRSGKSFPIKEYFTCLSNFVVYIIKCPCGLLYVGETIQHVGDRIASHKSTIRCGKLWLPIPHHFHEAKHNVAQLRFQVIDKVYRPRRGGNHIELLKKRESFWIHKLQTLAPKGLNREIDWLI